VPAGCRAVHGTGHRIIVSAELRLGAVAAGLGVGATHWFGCKMQSMQTEPVFATQCGAGASGTSRASSGFNWLIYSGFPL